MPFIFLNYKKKEDMIVFGVINFSRKYEMKKNKQTKNKNAQYGDYIAIGSSVTVMSAVVNSDFTLTVPSR